MTRFLLAGAAAFGMMTGAAMAQTSTSQTTTTTTTPLPTAPVVISSGSTVGHATLPDGDRTVTSGVSQRNSAGEATNTVVTNQTYPFSNMITTTTKTTHVLNGVATEDTTISSVYPGSGDAPSVMKSTRTYTVGSK